MRWRWKWDEKLLNQDAKRGTQEKRERANTNTTHLARNGQTLKRQGKRKRAEGRRTRTKTSGGGGGRKRLNQPDTAWTYKNLSTQRAKPTWREENARTHEKGRKGDPWGPSSKSKWCIHNACMGRDQAQRPSAVKSKPSGRLTCSTLELHAQFNLTNDQKERITIPASMSWSLNLMQKKGGCPNSGQLFNTSTSTSETMKKGQ